MNKDILEQTALAGRPLDCLLIDAHAHFGTGSSFPLYDASVESVIASMDRIGCRTICASPYAGLNNYADIGNREMLSAMKKYPDRIFGYMTADPARPERIAEQLEQAYAEGMRGIKIHVSASGIPYSHPNYREIYAFAEHHALPLLAHTWGGELADLEPQFSSYPSIRFILAHSGCCMREKYLELARKYENVCLETCFSACQKGLIEYFVDSGVADKLIWGSDMTFYSSEHQVGRVVFAEISLEDKYKILGKNAARWILEQENS